MVGTPVAGRNRAETEALIGFFVNTLPLRASLAGNPTFRELVERVRSMVEGVQLSAPFGRYSMAIEVAEAIGSRD